MVAGDTSVDLMALDVVYIAEFASAGWIEALDDLYTEDELQHIWMVLWKVQNMMETVCSTMVYECFCIILSYRCIRGSGNYRGSNYIPGLD